MTGNDTTVEGWWYPQWLLVAAADHACQNCGGHLPDHEWAVLDKDGYVLDCSEQTR